MKLTKTQSVFLAIIIPLTAITALSSIIAIKETYANKAYEAAANEAKIDEEIFASKVTTLNKVHNMYEKSNIIGFNNCIKLNPEAVCSKRMKQITNHFDNEYNTKLLKLLAEKSGVALSENGKTGKLTAVGKPSTNGGGLPYIYGKDLYIHKETKETVNTAIQGIYKNKDEVVSIGSKFAELGLKAQRENNQELTDVKKLLELYAVYSVGASQAVGKTPTVAEKVIDSTTKSNISTDGWNSHEQSLEAYKNIMERLELEEAKNSGAGSASGIGKAPSLMDTVVESGQRFVDNVVFSTYDKAIIGVFGCRGEELKTEFCVKAFERLGISFPRDSYIEKVIEWTNDEYEQSAENKHAKSS